MSAFDWIVLQKSKVAGRRIFRENTQREAIADSCNLSFAVSADLLLAAMSESSARMR